MFGRILKVNLTTGAIERGTIPAEYARDYIGGSGLGARLLWDAFDPAPDPLDPASPLVWMTGPLTGTGGPTTGRSNLCARSPHTGLWGEANIGGFMGPELRYAGYDILWITGRAAEPVYLWIFNDRVEIRPAGDLWGKADTYETQTLIQAETGQAQAKVACIGRAGENLVPYACIISDHGRAAGRTGMGAVMGSKHLKAIAVRGTGKIPLADEPTYKKLRVQSNKNLLEQNLTAVMKETGTAGSADYLQYLGDMPQKYWTQATFEGATNISGGEMANTILVGTAACQGCVISCGRVVDIREGPYATHGKAKGPEYETICAFGSQLLVDDLPMITALGDRCDRLGMDTIAAGNTIALAYLLFDRQVLTTADTGGVELHWGDALPCFDLLEQISHREGFGALLAKGSRALAEAFGVPELAVHVNGLDLPMHDPRAHTGQALAYLTSPIGASHNHSDYFMVEMGGSMEELDIPMTDRLVDEGKAGYVARHQYWRTVCNDLVICFFAVVSQAEIADLLTAATGETWDIPRMLQAGERAWNLKRMLNLRLGWSPEMAKLPHLLLQPLPDGGQEGHVPDAAAMLREYHAASGWDLETGIPTPAKLAELGLDFAAPS